MDCGQRLGRAEAQESILSGHGYSFVPSYLHLPCSRLAILLSICPFPLEKQPPCREVSATVPCIQESLLGSGFLDGVKILYLPQVFSDSSSQHPVWGSWPAGSWLQSSRSGAVGLLTISLSFPGHRERKKRSCDTDTCRNSVNLAWITCAVLSTPGPGSAELPVV